MHIYLAFLLSQLTQDIIFIHTAQPKSAYVIFYHRSDEALIFGRFACETVSYETDFGHHSLPGLFLSLSCADDFQNLSFTLGSDLR